MQNIILKDFQLYEKVSDEMLDAYREKLPVCIIDLWSEYGFGSFMHGFIKTINPSVFQEFVSRAYFRGCQSIPVFATGLGDLIVWEKNEYLTILRFRHGAFSIMEKGCKYFFNDILTDREYVNDFLKPKDYFVALHERGAIRYDECFGYVPILCLGGAETA